MRRVTGLTISGIVVALCASGGLGAAGLAPAAAAAKARAAEEACVKPK